MSQKEVDTAQSINSQSILSQHLRDYGQEMSESEVLTLTLSGFHLEQESSVIDLMSHRQHLQQAYEKINTYKNQSYQSHNAVNKFIQFVSFFSLQLVQPNMNGTLETSFHIHRQFINSMEKKINSILNKIQTYKQIRQRINRMKSNNGKINSLIHKKYNIGNYVQQMQLVKNLIDRINGKLNSGNFDYRFLQEIMSKQLIPYGFYQNYCYNIACIIISKRLNQSSLIIIKKNANLSQLFTHMKTYFFYQKDLYKNCSQFIHLIKCIRVINQLHNAIQDGFSYLFKPYFLQILEEVNQIEPVNFMKARSLMQFNDFTIETWKQFEQYQVERYVLWNYQQHNILRKTPLIQLTKLKESITFFKNHYQWINQIGLKSIKIHGTHDFVSQYLRASLLKILYPILSQIYYASIAEEKKVDEKKKAQFEHYWFYCIFGKYKNIYGLIGSQIQKRVNQKSVVSIDGGQLNNDQYYKYYQQMSQILSQEIKLPFGSEFKDLWTNVWIRFRSLDQPISIIKNQMHNCDEEIHRIYYIKNLQAKLQQCISKKSNKSDQRIDTIYGTIVNLNLNSCRYFLLRQGIKCLDKQVEKQIRLIREAAYSQLYG